MDVEQQGQSEQAQVRRGRGRPPGSKNKKSTSSSPSFLPASPDASSLSIQVNTSEEDTEEQATVLDEEREERLAYSRSEDKLSPFSSLLRHVLRHDHAEIARVARDMEVAEITIYRWMNGSSEPRVMHVKRLLEVLPEHRGNLTYAINQTFPGVLDDQAMGLREVSKDIYRRVLDLVTTTADSDALRWQVTQVIFDGAMLQLDSQRRGMSIVFAALMPAHEDGVHSLRESFMRGQSPWPYDVESRVYLGSTTLAGTAATTQRLQLWDDANKEERLQVDVDEFERSAAAYPVLRGGRIAGVLVASSAQPGFFSENVACQAVIEYAQLMSAGLRDEDFHDPSILNLRPMPSLRWQRTEVARSYLNRIMHYARKYRLSRQEAERQVILEMEQEFEERERRLSHI